MKHAPPHPDPLRAATTPSATGHHWRISPRLGLMAWLALGSAIGPAVGCVGSVGDGQAGGNGDPSHPSDPTKPNDPATPGPGGGGPITEPPTPPTVAAPGTCGAPVFSATLTREQYINTVTDLLGIDPRPLILFTDASGRKYRPDNKLSALEAEGFKKTARGIADAAVTTASLSKLLPCDPANGGESKCADQFIDQFGARAIRRPLSDDTRSDLRQLYDAGQGGGGFATGIKWVVEGLLQSPEFLYHLVLPGVQAKAGDVVGLNDFEVADRLSYFLWNSPPDEMLWSAASAGQLRTSDQLAAQVARMRMNPRSARTREDFYTTLLNLDLAGALTRDDPAYTPELAKALGRSALAGIHDVYEKDGKSDSLLGSPTVFVDPLLAKVYGAPAGTGSGTDLSPATFAKTERSGILTHPALMAIIAEHDTSDPIHRGTFVYTRMLCQNIPAPPDGVPPLPDLGPNLTTRQRLVEHRKAPQCAACHALFDPIGLAFENYDALGRYRAEEHGVKVDSSGEVTQADLDVVGKFDEGSTLMGRLAQSKAVRSCLAQEWYEYASRRDLDMTDKCAVDNIKSRFMASGDLNDLLASIAVSDMFRNRLVTQE